MASQLPRRCFQCINSHQLKPCFEKREFPSWLRSCFFDPIPYFCQGGGLIAETEVTLTSGSLDSSLFLVYLPLQQTYFAFQIQQGNIYVLISQRHRKCLKYRVKEDNYHHLTINASYEKHVAWKQKCSLQAFINYSSYWFWREECQRQGNSRDDYARYAKFRQECKITIGEEEKIRICHGKHVMTFFYRRWISCWSEEDFTEWKEYCQWKSKYYAQRCLYYESIPAVTWLQVAKCQHKACLTFIIFPDRIFWEVDGYQVYTYTPISPIYKVNIGIGVGGKTCHPRYDRNNNSCFAYFSSIYLYYILIPMAESCLTSQDNVNQQENEEERVIITTHERGGEERKQKQKKDNVMTTTTTTLPSPFLTKKTSNSVKTSGTTITGTSTNLPTSSPSLEIKTHPLTTISHPSEGAITTSLGPSYLSPPVTASSSFHTDDLNKIPSSEIPSHA